MSPCRVVKIASLDFNLRRAGKGPPFLWAHGLTASMAVEDRWGLFDWTQLGSSFELVRYDARGHGASAASLDPEDYQWSRLAGDLLAVADSLDLDQFAVGGVSMGCATSLLAALRAPRRVRALVLATPPTAWEERAAQARTYDQLADLVESQGLPRLIEMLRRKPILPAWALQENPATNDVYLEGLGAMNPGAAVAILRGAKLCTLPPRQELRRITQPALILAWPDDPAHPLSVAEELHELLPHSRLVVARSLAEARDWIRQISDFLAEHAPRP